MGYGIKLPACVYSGIGSIGDMKTIVKQESAKKVKCWYLQTREWQEQDFFKSF